jgi:hypothetical protein
MNLPKMRAITTLRASHFISSILLNINLIIQFSESRASALSTHITLSINRTAERWPRRVNRNRKAQHRPALGRTIIARKRLFQFPFQTTSGPARSVGFAEFIEIDRLIFDKYAQARRPRASATSRCDYFNLEGARSVGFAEFIIIE